MAHISFADGVAIAMLVFYLVSLPLSLFVAMRHGLAKASGWIFLTIFSVIRIVGCSAQLATISQGSNGTAATIAEITLAIGLSGLLLASLGLLSRLYNSILKAPWRTVFSFYVIKLVQTPCAVALILSIVGATNAPSPMEIYKQTTLQIGCIILAIVTLVLMILYFIALAVNRKSGRGEVQLVVALGLSLPLLIVRAIWPLVECFGGQKIDNTLMSPTKREFLTLFLANMEEVGTTLIYIVAGLTMRSVPSESGHPEGQSSKDRISHRTQRGDFGGGKLGLVSLGAEFGRSVLDRPGRRERREHPRRAGRR